MQDYSPQPSNPNGNDHRALTIRLVCAVVLTVTGAVLLLLGFYAPPIGEIHSSVLVAYGETLTFVGACFGIDWYHRSKK